MINIGVIVLNYLAYKETISFVESFLGLNLKDSKAQIVIVDNGSENESFQMLCTRFEHEKDITIVHCEKNLGFANGNNYGYYELKKKMDPDFVIVSNDDIILKDPGLVEWITESYENYGFAVLGPSVFSLRGGFFQSPCLNYTRNVIECSQDIEKLRVTLFKLYLKKLLKYPIHCDTIGKSNVDNNKSLSTELTLHGSFQVFSRNYFQYYTEPYFPDTFLYCEEDFLRLRCDKKGLIMLYNPSYEVNHMQAVSTDYLTHNNYDKMIKRTKCILKSRIEYRKFLTR